jgi:hypothetical protein
MISADLRCILRRPMRLRVYVGVLYEEWSIPAGAALTFDECNCLAVSLGIDFGDQPCMGERSW